MQTITGTVLLQHAILLTTHLFSKGGITIIEHPATPIWQPNHTELCSIWKTQELQILTSLPTNSKYTFKQSIHGQIASKPTTFFTSRIDKDIIIKNLYRNHNTCHKPEQTNHTFQIGIDQKNKQFNTAQLKEYPPSLNKAIALIFLQQINRNRLNTNHLTPPKEPETQYIQQFKHYHIPYDEYETQQFQMGQDYWTNEHKT